MLRQYTPAWVLGSAFALAAIAGSINAVAWLGVEHKGITHVTGALTEASTRAAALQAAPAIYSLTVVAAFMAGSVISGLLIRDPTLRFGRRYGVGLVLESLLLVGAFVARDAERVFAADLLAAMACGLQNALATSFSGAVLRTTHMTGVVTDLGLLLGHALRRQQVDWARFWLYLALITGFVAGGAGGAIASDVLGARALLLPAAAVGSGGLAYWGWVQARQDR